jgi:RNA polymerase sigma-70 factor, ECF subfamily
MRPLSTPMTSTPRAEVTERRVFASGSTDERATWHFDALYREHFGFAWRVVRRLGVRGQAVDDVVQDVFIVVHRRLGDFVGRSSVKTWLYGIIRRVVADHRRALRRKPGHDTPAATRRSDPRDPDALVGDDESPDARVEQSERVRVLHHLLAGLDEDKREVFILAELEELTIAEIAEALGANANTIGSRLRAARRQFESALSAIRLEETEHADEEGGASD